jgi:hypothetical protein
MDEEVAKLEGEMIRLEDEIDLALISATISPSREQENAFRAEAARLAETRDEIKEERRKLKFRSQREQPPLG